MQFCAERFRAPLQRGVRGDLNERFRGMRTRDSGDVIAPLYERFGGMPSESDQLAPAKLGRGKRDGPFGSTWGLYALGRAGRVAPPLAWTGAGENLRCAAKNDCITSPKIWCSEVLFPWATAMGQTAVDTPLRLVHCQLCTARKGHCFLNYLEMYRKLSTQFSFGLSVALSS